jgi:hypothetical protein
MYLLTQPALLDAILGFIAVHYSDVQCTAASSSPASSSAAAAGPAFSSGPVEEIREWMQLCCSGSSSGSSSSSIDATFYSGLEDHLRSRGYRVPFSTKKADAAGQSGAAAASAADCPSFNQHATVGKARIMWSELSQVRRCSVHAHLPRVYACTQ